MYRKRLAVWPSQNAVKKLKFQFVEDGLNVLEVFRKGPRDRGSAGACQFSKFWPCERPHKAFRESDNRSYGIGNGVEHIVQVPRKKVQCADDNDELFRDEVRLGLEEAGHQVTQLSNGNEGLKAFKNQRPDLVITNVVMDQGEGVETMKMMLELALGTPVIAISAFQSYLHSMEILGACHSLVKPFCMPALIEAVDSVMGSQGNS